MINNMNSNLVSLQRLHSRASLSGAATKVNMFDSAMIQLDSTNQQLVGSEGTFEQTQYKTSSHVNLGEITQYNAQQQSRRQRPQTGKLRTTQANIVGNMAAIPSSGQFSATHQQQPFKVIGQLHSQFKAAQYPHKRMASAKGDNRFRSKQPVESQLSNTRDVIQSYGHLTTMAGTNYEPQSRGIIRQHQHQQYQQNYLPPSQPIVRQHFMPNPTSKRLQSAKNTAMQGSTALMVSSQASSTFGPHRGGHTRPKSGVPQGRQLRPRSGHHNRLHSGKAISSRQNIQFNSTDNHQFQQSSPTAAANYLNSTTQPRQNQIVLAQHDIFLDPQGNEIDQNSDNGQQKLVGVDPTINLAIAQGVDPTQASRQQSRNSTTGRKSSGKHSSKRINSRQMRNQTIYRLPSLSQCIENKILPRSSEYMRRLYSIALRNHENQVPKMAPQRIALMDVPTTPTETQTRLGNDTVLMGQEFVVPGSAAADQNTKLAELQEQALGIAKDQSISPSALRKSPGHKDQMNMHDMVTNQAKVIAAEKRKIARSQSYATQKFTNLQFPFDNQTQGGFSMAKQRELAQATGKQSPNQDLSPNVSLTPMRKRPQTAGRLRPAAMPASDLFNNRIISQQVLGLASQDHQNQNHLNSEQNISSSNAHAVDTYLADPKDGGEQQQLRDDEANPMTSSRCDEKQAMGPIGSPQSGVAIVMHVKPQHSSNSQDNDSRRGSGKGHYDHNTSTEMKNHPEHQNLVLNLERAAANARDEDGGDLRPPKNAMLMSGASSARASDDRSRSAASRRLSAQADFKDPTFQPFFHKSSKGGLAVANSLSNRDFQPVSFQEKNGNQVVVSMSNQGLKLTSARQNSYQYESKSQGSRGSGTNRKKSKKTHPNAKMSSTHSLQINMTQKNKGNSSDCGSRANTNRLEGEESDVNIDERGGYKVIESSNPNTTIPQKRRESGSRNSSYLSNHDLRHIDEVNKTRAKPVRQIYPVNKSNQKFPPLLDESPHISLQSHTHSHNLGDPMRLKQVYIDDISKDASAQKINQPEMHVSKIHHRIPATTSGQGAPTLSPKSSPDRQKNQKLLIFTDGTDPATAVGSMLLRQHDVNMSTMSNPLNHVKMPEDKWRPSKQKIMGIDGKRGQVVKGDQSRGGYFAIDQQAITAEIMPLTPSRLNSQHESNVHNLQLSPSQRRNSHIVTNMMNSRNTERVHRISNDGTMAYKYESFKSHFKIKSRAMKPPVDPRNLSQTRRTHQPQKNQMRVRRAELVSKDDQKRQKQNAKKSRCCGRQIFANNNNNNSSNNPSSRNPQQSPQDLYIDQMYQLHANVLNEDMAQGKNENSKVTVPPLPLPMSDTATELLHLSHLPSSHRQNLGQLSFSQQSFTKLNKVQEQESQKILSSFNNNNVRSNFKGAAAMKQLLQDIDLSGVINADTQTIQMQQVSLSCSPQRRPHFKTQHMSMKQLTMANAGDSRRSLEKLMLGTQGDERESQENNVSNRDFAATLGKDKSQASKSNASSEEKNQTIASLNPKLDEDFQRLPIPIQSSPSPVLMVGETADEGALSETNVLKSQSTSGQQHLNIKNEANPATGADEEVIQEIEEGSSNYSRSKISVSVQSIRKKNESKHNSEENAIIQVQELPLDSNESKKVSASMRQLYSSKQKLQPTGSVIRSVYEMEAQALRSGVIKAYSGKNEKRRDNSNSNTNTDLQHFLSNTRNQGQAQSIVRQSTRKLDYQSNTNNSVRNSHTTKLTKPKSQESIASQNQFRGSKISLNQSSLSYIGFNSMPIAQKKVIEERPRTATPEDRIKQTFMQPSLDMQKEKAHKLVEEAKKIMHEAKLHKLQADVVNKQLLDLLRESKQETRHLAAMMNQATQELGTQTLQTGKVKRGFEIPFHISHPNRDQVNHESQQARRDQGSSILTKKLSSSSVQKVAHNELPKALKSNIPPSFAPASPTSVLSTVRQGEVAQGRPGVFTFAINSVGGSTNRFSKQELPFFGISSRVGEIVESQKTGGGGLMASGALNSVDKINDSFEFQNPSDLSQRKGTVMPVIDYSQNFLAAPSHISQTNVQIKSGQAVVNAQESFYKGTAMKGKKRIGKSRPQSSGRYTKAYAQKNATAVQAGLGKSYNLIGHQLVEQQQKQLLSASNNQTAEHPEQPGWAIRQNLKSKFNLMTAEQQQKQAQKFFIECKDDRRPNDTSKINDRGTEMQTMTHTSPVQTRNTISFVNQTPIHNGSPQGESPSKKISAVIQDIRIEEEINSRCDSPLMKKILSMPCDPAKEISLESENQSIENLRRSKPLDVDDESAKSHARGETSSSQGDENRTLQSFRCAKNQHFRTDLEHAALQVDRAVHNQSMQVSLTAPEAGEDSRVNEVDEEIYYNQLLTGAQQDSYQASSPRLGSQASGGGFNATGSSHKSLLNSRKVIEKVANQGYVRRSKAGDSHFSLTQNMINSSHSSFNKLQQHQQ